ncbi:MAG: hypothetical protein WDW38_003503 [Sanguina aurantia]
MQSPLPPGRSDPLTLDSPASPHTHTHARTHARHGRTHARTRAHTHSTDAQHPSTCPDLLGVTHATHADRLLRERIRRNRSNQQFCDFDEAIDEGPPEPTGEGCTSERLVVVANRLPVTCTREGGASGSWTLQVSAGGLVSALKGVSSYKTVWIGWPGVWVKPGRERETLTQLLYQEGCVPVWIDATLVDLYYNGFCNSVLWQLFHYVPLNIDSWQKMAEHRAMQMQWQAYQVANQKFADVVLEHYQGNDIVWIQDYHLMLLPSLLKNSVPKMKVGFFLHTPFPSSEIYRTLPVREEVLRAVLGADLIGFHTYDYARHFISSCTRILGLEGTPEGVENNGTITRVGTFPIGIDPERFTQAMETQEVQSHIAKLLNRYAGRKIMLGVDRLDMVKGIPQKLLAYEKFLEDHPEWRDKVLLVQIAVPTRTDVPEYQKLRSMVHEIVGRINGQFGTLTYVPIYHLDTSLSFTELCALYAVTDVALVTSLRDGMNLVSYEFVACQSDNAGVLVLSEFAGAAQSLGAGAVLVNPWNITDMAQAIEDSLSMSEEERRERHRQNYMHVQTHTAQNWADTFISELNDTHIEADLRTRHAPPALDIQAVVHAYSASARRLVVLGYNATLTTSVEAPRQPKRHFDTIRMLAKVNPKVMASILELCQCILVFFRSGAMLDLEQTYADVEFGRIQARDLLQHLWTGPISNAPVEIIQGGKSVEVRPVGITKGLAMQRIVAAMEQTASPEHPWAPFDLVLCIGHLVGRDENIFSYFEGSKIDGTGSSHNSRAERFAQMQNGALPSQIISQSMHTTRMPSDSTLSEMLESRYPGTQYNNDSNINTPELPVMMQQSQGFNNGGGGSSTGGSSHVMSLLQQQQQQQHHQLFFDSPQRLQRQAQQQQHSGGLPVSGVSAGGSAGGSVTAHSPSPPPAPVRSNSPLHPYLNQSHNPNGLSCRTSMDKPVPPPPLPPQPPSAGSQATTEAAVAAATAAAVAAGGSSGAHGTCILTTALTRPQHAGPRRAPGLVRIQQPTDGQLSRSCQLLPTLSLHPSTITITSNPPTCRPTTTARTTSRTAANTHSPPHPTRSTSHSSTPPPNYHAYGVNSHAISSAAHPPQQQQQQPQHQHHQPQHHQPQQLQQQTQPYNPHSSHQSQQQQQQQQNHPHQAHQPQQHQRVHPPPQPLPSHHHHLNYGPVSGNATSHSTTHSAPMVSSGHVPGGSRIIPPSPPLTQAGFRSFTPPNLSAVVAAAAAATTAAGSPYHRPASTPPILQNTTSSSASTTSPSPRKLGETPVAGPAAAAAAAAAARRPSSLVSHMSQTAAPEQQQQQQGGGLRGGNGAGAGSSTQQDSTGVAEAQGSWLRGRSSSTYSRHGGDGVSSMSNDPGSSQAAGSKFSRHGAGGNGGQPQGLRSGGGSAFDGPQRGQQSRGTLGAAATAAMYPSHFPPKYLFTCTVGRNRSKARFALAGSSDVADLLDSIVQQAIHHHAPPAPSDWTLGMNRIESFSSTEPLSPDSMFALINNWKLHREQAIHHHAPPAPSDWTLGMNRIESFSSTEPLSPDSMFALINNWTTKWEQVTAVPDSESPRENRRSSNSGAGNLLSPRNSGGSVPMGNTNFPTNGHVPSSRSSASLSAGPLPTATSALSQQLLSPKGSGSHSDIAGAALQMLNLAEL